MVQNVTDIDEIIKTWAWTHFKKNHPNKQINDFSLTVNWDQVLFKQGAVHHFEIDHADDPDPKIVFKSCFDNRTQESQENVFKTERTTTASVTSTVQKGYRRGWNVGLTITVPASVGNVTAGYGRDVTLNKSTQETQSTQLKWAVDTKVNVPRESRTIAVLQVDEKSSTCCFRTTVRIRGEVGVRIAYLEEPQKPPYYLQNSVATIFSDNQHLLPDEGVTISQNVTYVDWIVEGCLAFKYAVQQNVSVSYEELPALVPPQN